MAIGNTHKKIEVCLHCFQVMRVDRQTNRHTHHNTSQPSCGDITRYPKVTASLNCCTADGLD